MSTVSLCLTVLNESVSIDELMTSVVNQTRLPDEMVIVDGGSNDDTVERIEQYRDRLNIRVLSQPGATISAGRNRAIREAAGEVIAVTDAGVRLVPNWLKVLVEPIEDGKYDVVAGFFKADPRNVFEVAMGATVLPFEEDIDPAGFLPSSRSIAFRNEVWEAVGGYPEWLDYCEDLLFDLEYRRKGFTQGWAPAAIAHFRPRSTLRSFWLQYYRYARGDGKADLWRKRQAARYATYFVGAPVGIVLGARYRPLLPLLGLAGLVYLKAPILRFLRLSRQLTVREKATGLLWLPIIRLTGDFAKMAGYPAGVRWRIARRREGWVPPA